MQTFLPYADFARSARCLDRARLGKQRVEAMQILQVLSTNITKSWGNHPAVRMWRGYETALMLYRNVFIVEWLRRGYANTIDLAMPYGLIVLPPWIDDERVHASHRANLLRKMPQHYGHFGWTEDSAMPYFWPV